MKGVRVLIASMPRLMRELVMEIISAQPDIEVLVENQKDSAIQASVAQFLPDFLIVSLEKSDSLPGEVRELLEQYPHVKIIGIAPDRNTTIFYWASLNIWSNRIESSEEGILRALRGTLQLVERRNHELLQE